MKPEIIVIRFDADGNGTWVVELVDTQMDVTQEILQTVDDWEAERTATNFSECFGLPLERR